MTGWLLYGLSALCFAGAALAHTGKATAPLFLLGVFSMVAGIVWLIKAGDWELPSADDDVEPFERDL